MSGTFAPAELSALFTEIGRRLARESNREQLLNVLADIAAQEVPGAAYAGITLGREQQDFATIAATHDKVLVTDQIQYDLRSGPCVDAILTDTTFNTADLREDQRWPEFGQRAFAATGILSMLSLRLYLETDGTLIAGLNMYSEQPAAFDDASETIAVLLATHASLAVGHAAAQQKAMNLLIALHSSREIGTAMGIIMANAKVTRDQAFDLLRIASQRSHRKVAEIATEVADTGTLPDIPNAR